MVPLCLALLCLAHTTLAGLRSNPSKATNMFHKIVHDLDHSEPIAMDETFIETAERAHIEQSILAGIVHHQSIPEGHVQGGSYHPDFSLKSYLQDDSGNEEKVEGLGDELATGTASILQAMFQHYNLDDKLIELAHSKGKSVGHDLATSLIEETHLQQHGLSMHSLETIHATVGAMNERVFEQIRRGSEKTSVCPSAVDPGQGGGNVLADAMSSGEGDVDVYKGGVEKPKNFDPSATSPDVDVNADTERENWELYSKARALHERVTNILNSYAPTPHDRLLGHTQSDTYRKLALHFSKCTSEQATETMDLITTDMELDLNGEAMEDKIVNALAQAAETGGGASVPVGTTTSGDHGNLGDLFKLQSHHEELQNTWSGARKATMDGVGSVEKGRPMVESFQAALKLIQSMAADKMKEIDGEDKTMSEKYKQSTIEFHRMAVDRANEDLAPDATPVHSTADNTPKKTGLGAQIKDLFKKEWVQMKSYGGPIVKLLKFLKLG